MNTTSLLTIFTTPELLLYILWTSLGAAALVVIMPILLLSFDELMDTSKTYAQRVRTSPLAKPMLWVLFSLSLGLIVFCTMFFGQLLMHTTTMSVYQSMAAGFGVFLMLEMSIIGLLMKWISAYWRQRESVTA